MIVAVCILFPAECVFRRWFSRATFPSGFISLRRFGLVEEFGDGSRMKFMLFAADRSGVISSVDE